MASKPGDYQLALFDEQGQEQGYYDARPADSAQQLLDRTASMVGLPPSGSSFVEDLYSEPARNTIVAQQGDAAPLTLVPTSTTNPARPRTLAAGYESDTQTLTVLFRDGTLYNYYNVTHTTWNNFRSAISKGVFILTHLDSHDHGKASADDEEQLIAAAQVGRANAMQHLRAHTSDAAHLASTIQFGKKELVGDRVRVGRYRARVMELITSGKNATTAVQQANREIFGRKR